MNIDELLKNMTIKEKIGQCVMIEPVFLFESINENDKYTGLQDEKFLNLLINEYHIGTILFGGITRIENDLPIEWARYLKKINDFSRKSNKIPMLIGVDAIHGVNFVKGTTIFSHNLGVASTWNPKLAETYMDTVGKELVGMGINLNFAPTIDVARDPRWGRVYESLGEDQLLASRLSTALVTGLQKDKQIAACAKHFIGYGESNYGFDRTPADITERTLKEIHIPPFKAAIEAGVKSIMVNGGDLNGIAVPASKKVITNLLKEELNFHGIVMSDWEDVSRLITRHRIARNKSEAIKRSFNAGLDMSMIVSDLETLELMEKLVRNNEITMERLNQAVKNILQVKADLGLYKQDYIDLIKTDNNGYKESTRLVAKQIAEESFVLLKNDFVLPLNNDHKRILLTGKTANSRRHLCGGWTLNWASANEEDLHFETIYDVLSKKSNLDVVYAENLNELKNVDLSKFDKIISIVGEEPHSEWLGDSYDMEIEQDEKDILEYLRDLSQSVIVVSLLARPQNVKWIDDFAKAILWAYTPGSEGAKAIVDMLFGVVSPSGKTPITFPKSANQVPLHYNMRGYFSGEIISKYDPLYPFGYGLSYSKFEYSELDALDSIKQNETLIVKVKVKNIGKFIAKEVVQLYMTDMYASVNRPLKQLKAFEKIELKPDEEKEVTLTVTSYDLSFYDEFMNYVNEPREVKIMVSNLEKVIKIN